MGTFLRKSTMCELTKGVRNGNSDPPGQPYRRKLDVAPTRPTAPPLRLSKRSSVMIPRQVLCVHCQPIHLFWAPIYTFRYVCAHQPGHTEGSPKREFFHSFVSYFIFVRCLPVFSLSREGRQSLEIVDRLVKFLCPQDIVTLHCWAWCKRKSRIVRLHRGSNPRPNCQGFEVTGLPGRQKYLYAEIIICVRSLKVVMRLPLVLLYYPWHDDMA